MATPALDRAARQMGYKNYAQYAAFQARQEAMRQAPVTPAPRPRQPAPEPKNWLQSLVENYTPLGAATKKVKKAIP